MNKNIEQAKEQVFSYYKDFIDKCINGHGIDLHTIISDCVTAGYKYAQCVSTSENKKPQYRCTLCHSIDIKAKLWDNPNNQGQTLEFSDDDDDRINCWCNRCETHVEIEPIHELFDQPQETENNG
ncbi:MAG: hypothetical protein LBT43_07440 [Prevotella sp.]|jgi:hypothetical protein|nr:hypothetical protein [Prevotella sp.]